MRILRTIKRKIYFLVATYFALWAKVFLHRWKPMIITVTGSSGKTTLLHLLEAQLGNLAVFSHHANSAFGIPFHILGLERKSYKLYEWLVFGLLAPFKMLRSIPDKKIYVTEADAERPGEGRFLAKLLKPDVVIWLSLEEAHGVNYDSVAEKSEDVRDGVRKVMAHEFGYFIEYAKKYVVLNADNPYIMKEAERTFKEKILVTEKDNSRFTVEKESVKIETIFGTFAVPQLIPKSAALSVVAVILLLTKLQIETDKEFKEFVLPPGRSSVLQGTKGITIIDSSYNATFDGVRTMLDLMGQYPAHGEKWLVLGDMIEQGKSEKLEHEELASLILALNPQRVVLVGPRLREYTHPRVPNSVSFLMPKEALDYLEKELKGGETILFKGARYLEGVVEKLLQNPNDASKLCRREQVWVEKRKQWGI
jgi:UDP-N-acetylmuramoyl-tripeptide--D-alanyl-D-alanine ligase